MYNDWKKTYYKRAIPIGIMVWVLFVIMMIGTTGPFKTYDISYGEAIEDARLSEVLVESGNLRGTGCIWDGDGSNLIIITAAHVIDDPEDIDIIYDSQTVEKARLLEMDEELDIAYVEATGHGPYKIVKRKDKLPKESESVIIVDAASPDASIGVVAEPDIYVEDFDHNMIYCRIEVNEGMSGSGLYDKKGNFIGILLGGSDSAEAVCLSTIYIK